VHHQEVLGTSEKKLSRLALSVDRALNLDEQGRRSLDFVNRQSLGFANEKIGMVSGTMRISKSSSER
jgi:hypothetical protein